jgi:hypothetical protein
MTRRVLVRSPAETERELRILCLFPSTPENARQGALVEGNEKLKGLLDKDPKPELARGDLRETIVIAQSAGSLAARKLLAIGLGNSGNLAWQRLEPVGSIGYRESDWCRASVLRTHNSGRRSDKIRCQRSSGTLLRPLPARSAHGKMA